jgi:hypothetical protein
MKNDMLRAAADSAAWSNGPQNATGHTAASPANGAPAATGSSHEMTPPSLSAIATAIAAGTPASTARILRNAWRTLAASAPDLTAKKAIKRLRPHLVALGYGPATIDDDAIASLLGRLAALGRPSPRAETNSFIRAFNAVMTLPGSSQARLTPLPTVQDARAGAWAARPGLDQETGAVIDAFQGKLAPHRFKAGVMRLIVMVEEAGLPCECLHDLLTPHAIAAVIRMTSPRGISAPSPARVHALYLLTAIAKVLDAKHAVIFINKKKKSKGLKMKGHTALLPTATLDRIALYDDRNALLWLLRTVTRALFDALDAKLCEANLYNAQSALAFMLAFYGGLAPTQIALCQFGSRDPDVPEDHQQESNGALVTVYRAQKGYVSVNLSDAIQVYVMRYRVWLAAHGLRPDAPFVTMRGTPRPGKNVEHSLASFLRQIGSNLRPLDVRDLGCSELFRAKRSFAFVRDHLRASSTENVANRLRQLRARIVHTHVQDTSLERAEAINARLS